MERNILFQSIDSNSNILSLTAQKIGFKSVPFAFPRLQHPTFHDHFDSFIQSFTSKNPSEHKRKARSRSFSTPAQSDDSTMESIYNIRVRSRTSRSGSTYSNETHSYLSPNHHIHSNQLTHGSSSIGCNFHLGSDNGYNFSEDFDHSFSDKEVKRLEIKDRDTESSIIVYEDENIHMRQFHSSRQFNVCRKSDIVQYVETTVNVAQLYAKQMIEEVVNYVTRFYLSKNSYYVKSIKLRFEDGIAQYLDHSKELAIIYIKKYIHRDYQVSIWDGLDGMDSTISDQMKSQIYDLISSLLRNLFLFISNLANDLTKYLGQNIPTEKIQEFAKESVYFKKDLNEIRASFKKHAFGQYMSSKLRKILISRLVFEQPISDIRSSHQFSSNQIQSFCISIPLNCLFDRVLYKGRRSCRCTKDRSRPGLVNGYNTLYVKNGKVLFESFRTGSLPAIGIPISTRSNERKVITEQNCIELLKAVAVNHCKRYTVKEISRMMEENGFIQIPFTSVALLTPFFLTDREDQQLIEHHETLIECFDKVQSIEYDACETKSYAVSTKKRWENVSAMKVKIKFIDPVLVNFGTNILIKTFKLGLGIQRVINTRLYGMRRFEKNVQKFLSHLRERKTILRNQFQQYLINQMDNLEKQTQSSNTLKIYRNDLLRKIQKVNQFHSLIYKFKQDNAKKLEDLDSMLQKSQIKLEGRITNEWIQIFDNITKNTAFYQQNIKPLVSELDEIHSNKIFPIEMSNDITRWSTNILNHEYELCKDYENIIDNLRRQIPSELNLIATCPHFWDEYKSMIVLEKDIWNLFSDLEYLYHTKGHERFVQGIIESKDVNDLDPYMIPVRILMISFLMGYQCHFNCKSGKDRTGECNDQCFEFAEVKAQYGEYTTYETEKKMFGNLRRSIHTVIAINGGTLQVINENLGIPGSKADAAISGRFLPGFYKKYRGLVKLDKMNIAANDDFWKKQVIEKSLPLYQ